MSKVSLETFVAFFNFTCILSIKHSSDGSKMKTLKFLSVFNVLITPSAFFFSIFIMKSQFVRSFLFKNVVSEAKTFSTFSRNLILFSSQHLILTMILISLINLCRRGEILNFIKKISEVELEFSLTSQLQALWKKLFIWLSFLLFIVSLSQFVSKMNVSLLSISSFVLCSYPYIVLTGWMSFLKAFELFFMILLKDFKFQLKIIQTKTAFGFQDYRVLMEKYHKIHALNSELQKVFGTQFTLLTCCVTVMTTLQVCMKK